MPVTYPAALMAIGPSIPMALAASGSGASAPTPPASPRQLPIPKAVFSIGGGLTCRQRPGIAPHRHIRIAPEMGTFQKVHSYNTKSGGKNLDLCGDHPGCRSKD